MALNNKKILILYTSIGLGHKSIAENIGFYLEREGYGVSLFDAHKIQDSALVNGGGKVYPWLLKKFPFVWDWLYNTQWFISLALPFRTILASFNYSHILKKINEIKPDLIISTHNTSSAVISYLKSKQLYQGKFGIAFSDFHLHRFWLFNNADFYLANIKEQKQEMESLGISPSKIFVCGMTLKPKLEVEKVDIRSKLNIPSNHKIILFSSGSQGIGLNEEILKQLTTIENATVIAVCGKNQFLAEQYNQRFGPKVKAFGFYQPMEQLYAIADIFVGKPGGLSTAEALSWHLPMFIFYVLPGGEQFNFNYLLKHQLVMAPTKNVIVEVSQELTSGEFRKSLDANPYLPEILSQPQALITAVKSYLY